MDFAGHLHLRAAPRAFGHTALTLQSFRAPFHLSKPYWDYDSRVLLVQVVNPTAGILAGDRIESEITVDAGAALLITTPSASRVFRMDAGVATCRQHFTVAAGAWLEVMPGPLVPHRGSDYRQSTIVELTRGAGGFFVDQLMPGRAAHGEAWAWRRLCLEFECRLDGRLLVRERVDQSGEELRALAELAGSGAAACFANAILIPGAEADEDWRAAVEGLHRDGAWVGVSALREAGWSIKVIAPDGAYLRETLRAIRAVLAEAFPRMRCDPRRL
ncbi:urease accessory protein UreD [Opitutus terrae]|uniref:Urease accessory protein UreD n=1 Tax=Opitutus terrae (strain DSM 11246 / JCM 15787 / PB90-1) TaxID=452637 RepID=URED_OPITP|nr:urease accessory protein UreD [Opitutus terrae]B1ZNZ6.1 RecName: Full=Urease accessory protein UreD [Opitutus terrae PB90-1]ACB77485.1 Urease accessory protein UreD [Opitutus terrae PB90-1]